MDTSYRERMEEIRDLAHTELYPDFKKATLKLELSETCNHRCVFCIHAVREYPVQFMDEALLYRLMEEGRELGVPQLTFQINGEPLVCRELHTYVQYAKKIGYPYVFINTNGALATPERLRELIDAGIDSIKYSINAGTRESYRKVHGRDDFDKVIASLRFANQYRRESGRPVKLLSTFAVTKYAQDEDEIAKYRSIIGSLADEYVVVVAHDSAGQMPREYEEYRVTRKIADDAFAPGKKAPCANLFEEIHVIAKGYMTTCPSDFSYYMTTYDMTKTSLKDAWHGEEMVQLRRRHIANQVDGLLCNLCINKIKAGVSPLNSAIAYPLQELS